MKILIKAQNSTYELLKTNGIGNFIGCYWNFLHYGIFKSLGHQVKFFGEKAKDNRIINKHEGYDILFFRGYNSFVQAFEFAVKTLKAFKGRKVLYLEGVDKKDIGQYFDTVFIPELKKHYNNWKAKYPKKDIRFIPWTSPEPKLMDSGTNPYPDDKFRIIYTGIFNDRYLKTLIKLAKKGENIVLGGIYYDGKKLRWFKEKEVQDLHPNIQLIGNLVIGELGRKYRNCVFRFGTHFPYLRYANLAYCFYSRAEEGHLSSKLTEFLCSGLPVVCENSVPNRYRIKQYNAGTIVKWDDFNAGYEAIQKEKELKRNREDIMSKARYFHNPVAICEKILK